MGPGPLARAGGSTSISLTILPGMNEGGREYQIVSRSVVGAKKEKESDRKGE